MFKHMFLILSTLFIIAVSWHVSYPSNILVFSLMFLLILFYGINPFPIPQQTVYIIIAALFIYVFLLFINLTMYEKVNFSIIEIFIKKIGLAIFIFTFFLLFYKDRKEILYKSIEYALWIIMLLWMIQFLVFYTTGEYIDLLQPFAGEERPQRYQAYFIQSELPFELVRPTSIYIEPGTYAVNTFPLLVLSYLHHKKIVKLHVLVLFTYFASLSLFGIIIATLFIFVSALLQFEFKINKTNIIFFILFIIVALGIQEYLYFRFIQEENTGALAFRDSAVGYWLSLDSQSILMGAGNGNTIFWKSSIVDDSSFIFKLIFEYGLFAVPLLFFMFFIAGGTPIIFLCIILITKFHYLIYSFWLFLAVLHHMKQDQIKQRGA